MFRLKLELSASDVMKTHVRLYKVKFLVWKLGFITPKHFDIFKLKYFYSENFKFTFARNT